MIIWLSFFFATLAYSAFPMPPEGKTSCYRRAYTAEHLRRNPGQSLQSLYVWLRNPKPEEEDYRGARVLGINRAGETFSNRSPVCEPRADGSVFCFVECDGGSFRLEARAGGFFFRVSKDYFFPLYRNGGREEELQEGDVLPLDGNDGSNSLYRLEPVPENRCRDVFSRSIERDFGC